MTIVDCTRPVTGGVDTHLDLNVAAALDSIGGLLGVAEFRTTRIGHGLLVDWLGGFGPVARVGVEGTGSYGAGLARFLRGAAIEVVEVDRPNRQARRRTGKSDPADAIEAARAALSGRAQGAGKTRDGNVEAIRALVVAKRSARSSKIKALNQIRHLGFTASDELRERFSGISRQQLGAAAARLRPRAGSDAVTFATKTALSILGRRVLALDEEKERLNVLLAELVGKTAPSLLELHGVGVDTAATLLVAAGDNPGRLRCEAAWAHLCGVAPIQASSGKVTRYRLNRGGDRQANSALWGIVITRLRSDPRTQMYMERRLKEGRSKPEIIRVLKRYVAREIYPHLPRG
ncbi:MAG: IS110 family transposase [Actinobacteria bacterium]|nr:MAG: IS110 family transposase [Actinomycetota bacterium]